jgi:hypothetical protein
MKDLKEKLDYMVILEILVQKVLPVKMELVIQRVHQVQRENQGYLEWLVMKDHQVIEEMMHHQVNINFYFILNLFFKVLKVKLDQKDRPVNQAKMEHLELLEIADHRVKKNTNIFLIINN